MADGAMIFEGLLFGREGIMRWVKHRAGGRASPDVSGSGGVLPMEYGVVSTGQAAEESGSGVGDTEVLATEWGTRNGRRRPLGLHSTAGNDRLLIGGVQRRVECAKRDLMRGLAHTTGDGNRQSSRGYEGITIDNPGVERITLMIREGGSAAPGGISRGIYEATRHGTEVGTEASGTRIENSTRVTEKEGKGGGITALEGLG